MVKSMLGFSRLSWKFNKKKREQLFTCYNSRVKEGKKEKTLL